MTNTTTKQAPGGNVYPAKSDKKASLEDTSPFKQEKETDSNLSDESPSREHTSAVDRRNKMFEDEFSLAPGESLFDGLTKNALRFLEGIKETVNDGYKGQFETHFREIFKEIIKHLSRCHRLFGSLVNPRSYVGLGVILASLHIVGFLKAIANCDRHKHIAAIQKIIDTETTEHPTPSDQISEVFSSLTVAIDSMYDMIDAFIILVIGKMAEEEVPSDEEIEYLAWFREALDKACKSLEKSGLAEDTEELHR